MDSKNKHLEHELKRVAKSSGIDLMGFAEAAPFDNYLWKTSKRRDPRLALGGAKSIIVAGVYIGGAALPSFENPSFGRTSRLYLSGYFLDVVEPLMPLVEVLGQAGFQAAVCNGANADTSIVPLKLAAIRAGLGWQGRNSLLITKRLGTFIALGAIVTDAELQTYEGEERNRCAKCTLCQEACPTHALDTPFVLDRNKCLSYLLQIGDFPDELRRMVGNRVGDCEICQQACPWNKKHIAAPLDTPFTRAFKKQIPFWEAFFPLERLVHLTPHEYQKTLIPLGTGISYDTFMRNVAIAAQNANDSQSAIR